MTRLRTDPVADLNEPSGRLRRIESGIRSMYRQQNGYVDADEWVVLADPVLYAHMQTVGKAKYLRISDGTFVVKADPDRSGIYRRGKV